MSPRTTSAAATSTHASTAGPWKLVLLACAAVIFIVLERQWLAAARPFPAVADNDGAAISTTSPTSSQADLEFLARQLPREGKLPPLVLDRHKDWRHVQQLRRVGYRVLQQFGHELRNFITAYGSRLSVAADMGNATTGEDRLFRQRLQALAPWLPLENIKDHNHNDQQPKHYPHAILVSAGDRQGAYLKTLMHTVRAVHASQMPIFVSYRGKDDLSPVFRDKLTSQFNHLNWIDVTQHFDCDRAQLKGWNLRFFGLLLVPADEVIILDADVLMLQPPERFFTASQQYNQTGALLFHDRIFPERRWQPRLFLKHLQPQPSALARKLLRMDHVDTNAQSTLVFQEHVQESGVLVLDTRRSSVQMAIWTACLLLGMPHIRRFAQWDLVYGDKEFYWTAFELVHAPYAFSSYYPGVLGGVVANLSYNKNNNKKRDTTTLVVHRHNDDQHLHDILETVRSSNNKTTTNASYQQQPQKWALCGRLLHFDDDGVPLWSNGGYLTQDDDRKRRDRTVPRGLNPVLYTQGGRFPPTIKATLSSSSSSRQEWKLHPTLGVEGLVPPSDSGGIQRVPNEIRLVATAAVDYYLAGAGQ